MENNGFNYGNHLGNQPQYGEQPPVRQAPQYQPPQYQPPQYQPPQYQPPQYQNQPPQQVYTPPHLQAVPSTTHVTPTMVDAGTRKTGLVLGIVSLALGICALISFILTFAVSSGESYLIAALALSIVGVVLGSVSRKKRKSGNPCGLTGFIISLVMLVLSAIAILFALAAVIFFVDLIDFLSGM